MNGWVIGGLVLLVAIVIILFSSLKVKIDVGRKKADDDVSLEVRMLFGLIRFRYAVTYVDLLENWQGWITGDQIKVPFYRKERTKFFPLKMKGRKGKKNKRSFMQQLQMAGQFHRIAKSFLKKVKVDKFRWDTRVGTGDAAETGIICGLIWGVKGSVAGMISNYMSLKSMPRIHVSPSFNRKIFTVQFQCIVRMRIGNLIVAGIRLWINLRKGRDHKWQKTNTPYRV